MLSGVRRILPVILALVLSACQGGPFSDETVAGAELLSDETNVLVLVDSTLAANALEVNAARRNYVLVSREPLPGLGMVLLEFRRPPGTSGPIAIRDMQRMEATATAGLDHLFRREEPETKPDTPGGRRYADTLIGWPMSGCKAAMSVGMIDGAIDESSASFEGRAIVTRDFTDVWQAPSAHGTAVAELLVGDGRLQGSRLHAASVILPGSPDLQAGAGVSEVIRALSWLDDEEVDIINISLAGPYNRLLERAINASVQRGTIIVAAVGNDGPGAPPLYPAAFDNVIAVTAIDSAREVYGRAVRGEHLDFAAPGVDVFVDAAPAGRYFSGTSVAAPFVTALIATGTAARSPARLGEVRERLGRDAVDLGPAGRDPIFGTGLIGASGACEQPD